jgi:GH25 family lysozyme M1 (1,4-beta-N-acetylmuramidase)
MPIDPLVADCSAQDGIGQDQINKLAAAGLPWIGMYLKATEGTYYPANRPTDREWFLDNWMRVRVYAGVRYGKTWFRGAYHYLRCDEDGLAQADNFLALVDEAGGWGPGDLWPMIDVESAEQPATVSAQQIIDCGRAFTTKVKAVTGRRCTLYGNIYLFQNGITDHLGCDTLIVARYTADLPPVIYNRIGWSLANPAAWPSVVGWQLDGDGQEEVVGYPKDTPMGPCDYSAMIIGGGGQAAIDWIAANLNTPP